MFKYQNLRLLPGDRVLIPKSQFKLVQHHAIYAGNGWFFENVIGKGVVYTHQSHFFKGVSEITSVIRFNGNNYQRQLLLSRAQELLGRPYHLTNFNCEHFADYVQFGFPKSKQVETVAELFGAGMLLLVGFQIAKKL